MAAARCVRKRTDCIKPHKTPRPAMRFLARLTLAGSALGFAACATAHNTVPTVSTEQAMADQRRPAEDVALDAQRRGDAVLELSNTQPGWEVADIMQGAGYFTRLFVTKAGPSGKVYALSRDEFMRTKPVLYGDSLDILSKANLHEIVTLRSAFRDLAFPEPLDMVFTSQNYHDLHQRKFPLELADQMNAKVFNALKPGGIYVVIHHVANPGAPTRSTASTRPSSVARSRQGDSGLKPSMMRCASPPTITRSW